MQESLNPIVSFVESSPLLIIQLIETVGVIFLLWLIRFIIIRLVRKNSDSKKTEYKWRKNTTYATFFIGALLIGQIWFSVIGELGTYLGLLSAGIAIALKEPVASIAGWMYIIGRKPFDIGDRIEIAQTKGDVIDISVFKFTLLEIGNWVDADQSTGRVIHVPNYKVFQEEVANYTSNFEFIWQEISVLITFESNWKKAKRILQDIVDTTMQDFIEQAREQIKHAEKSYLIQYQYLTPIVYTGKKDSGVNLTIRYLSDPRKRRSTSQAIWESVFDRFAEHEDIQFAYPTIRYYGGQSSSGEQSPFDSVKG